MRFHHLLEWRNILFAQVHFVHSKAIYEMKTHQSSQFYQNLQTVMSCIRLSFKFLLLICYIVTRTEGSHNFPINQAKNIVCTVTGCYHGVEESKSKSGAIKAWFGIPYAAHPVGKLRFKVGD